MIGDFVYGNTTLGGLLVPAAIRGVAVSVQVVQLSEALGQEAFIGEGVFSQVLQLSEGLAKESFIGVVVSSQPDQSSEGLGFIIAQPVPVPIQVYQWVGGHRGSVQTQLPRKQKIWGEAKSSNRPQEVYAVGRVILLAERRRRREEDEFILYLMFA
jgi:hypothetical protein